MRPLLLLPRPNHRARCLYFDVFRRVAAMRGTVVRHDHPMLCPSPAASTPTQPPPAAPRQNTAAAYRPVAPPQPEPGPSRAREEEPPQKIVSQKYFPILIICINALLLIDFQNSNDGPIDLIRELIIAKPSS